jgi:capsular polysaccharide biosynthesis protein
MNLIAFAELLLRRGWIILLLAVLGGALGLAFAVTQPSVYEAVTRVAVRPMRPADLGQTQAIREVMNSYMQDIGTLDMAQAVGVRLSQDPRCAGYDRDPGRLQQKLGVSSDLNVYEIQIKARSRDSTEAVCVSEKWAEAFVDRREKANLQLDPLDRILTQQRDDTAVSRAWPQRRLIVLAAAALGLLLGFAFVLLREYLERAVIRSASAAEQLAGVPVLATVPAAPGDRHRGGALGESWREARVAAGRWLRLGWPLVVLAVLGAAAAYGLSVARPEIWRARTRIAVEPARGSDWGQTQAIREIMKGYSEDLKTRRMAEQVNEQLQLDTSPEALLAQLSVAPKEDVYEIVVDVLGPDREQAKAISRAWATLFVEARVRANLELDQRDRILTRLRDQTVADLWAPKRLPNTLAGAVLGALVGLALVFLWQVLQAGIIHSGADASRAAGVPLLGVIPPRRG